jgi:hypothetical protein
MRAIARHFFICGFAALLALAGSTVLAAVAEAQPTGSPPAISPVADSNTTSPQVGDTLTEVPATWSGTPITTSIQWFDCDSSGQNCNPIAGATGLPGSTYTVAASDVGSTIEVAETDTDGSGTATLSSGPTLVVGLPPSNTVAPTVSGILQQGRTLTETNGTWTNKPTSFSHQWLRCDSLGSSCAAIHSATGQSYNLTSADVGNTIAVEETASNAAGAGTPADSAATAVITLPPPVNTSAPKISGTAQQGRTLSETNGTWTNGPNTFSHQWLDCNSSGNNCSDVASNGTGQTYVLVAHDIGRTIEVQETATNAAGPGAPAHSSHTAVVTRASAPLPTNSSLPTISGTPQQGQTLTEINGTWTNNPSSFSYQWLRCDSQGNHCAAILTATGKTYALTSADVNNTIAVEETASNASGAGAPADSAPTAIIGPPSPVNQALPAIAGTAQQGQTLTEINGTWNPAPTSLSYQWLDCDSSGINCTTIANATGPTYAPTANLVGARVAVRETAIGSGGSGVADSAPTAVITLNPSTTTLLTVPGAPVTNQTVTLIATVTSSFALAPPAGSVSFDDAGAPIGGCSAAPVSTLSQSVQVTCQNSFSAAASPHALTAVFTPNSGAGIAGSTSPALNLPVGQASTSTTLDVNPTVFAGSKATYTATVATGQGDPVQPSGAVRFADRGKPIASCSSQALVLRQGSLSAQCTVRYRKSGRHTITAQYGGDGNFSGSASSSQAVKVQLRPSRIGGAISAKTYWTDYFTPTYTRFLAMVVHNLHLGTTIVLICRGNGCPFARQSLRVTSKPCGPKAGCVTEKAQIVDLFPRLRWHKLRVGTVLTVELTRPNWIGKAYVISIRSGRRPGDRIQCLAPGSTRPGVGC